MGESLRVLGALGLGVAAVSSAATVILLAEPLPPLWIAAARVFVTALAMGVLSAAEVSTLRRAFEDRPSLRWRAVLSGALLAVHFGAWIASLSLTTVLRSTAIVALQPVFAGLLGRALGDRVSPWLYAGVAVSIGGLSIMLADATLAGGSVRGDALALLGAAAVAGYFAVGRSVRAQLPLRPYLAVVNVVAGVLLVGAASLVGPPGRVELTAVGAVVYLGLVPGVVGHGLFNWVVRHAPVDRVALAILLEPIGASALAWLVLGRAITWSEALGAAVVLLGVAVGSIRVRTDAR